MQNTTINTVLKYAIIIGSVLITFIPLYVANPLFFPFITGKAFAFRIIVEIILALWLILMLRERGTTVAGTEKGVAPRINLITISVTAFTFIVLIADLFGLNPLRSIWSNFERMEGWMTIIHLWAYFIVLSSVLSTKENWNKFFNVILVSGLITAFYGLFQFFGWAETHQGATRVDASLGNSAYMAVYMLINAFLAGYMAFSAKVFNKKSLVWVYSILAVFFSFIMLQTSTRGTILGWIAGILIMCVIYAIFGRSEKGQGKGESNKTRMIACGVILLTIILSISFYFGRNASWIQKNAVLGRLATISLTDTKTQARGFIWPMAIKGTFGSVKTAVIGIGQENFNYIFNKDYNPQMWMHEQWFDRAHSVFIDWLVASGLLGLLAYLALYVTSFVYIWKSDLTLGQRSALIGLLVGYGIHNIFVFDNQTSYVMFFTFLAFVHSLKSGLLKSKFEKVHAWFRGSEKSVSENAIVVRDYVFVPIIALAFIAGFYFINVRNIQANTRLIDALRACSGQGAPSVALFEKALALNQTNANQEIREQLISCASNVLNSSQAPTQIKSDFYALTKKEIENQIAETPGDARIYVIGGSFFNSVGDFATALPILEKAHELSPGKQAVAFELASNYINIGKAQEAIDLIKQAYESAPDYPLAKSAYVMALINAGQEKKAYELFPNDPDLFTDQRVINVYAQKKQFSKVIEIYKKLVAQKPNDVQTHFYLAAAYLADKQNWQAIQELNAIAKQFPETKTQIDTVIKDIQAGKNVLGN